MEVPCPSQFDFVAEHWPQWKQRFMRFRSASDLSTKSEQRQVNMLLYCIGERSEDILTSFNLSDDDVKKFNTVLRKFDDFFGVQKNLVFEYAQFVKRKQQPGECATDYITAVFKLAETCEFGELREQLIMCQLAVGISDEGLSMRLQRDKTLTLDKAITEIKLDEQVKGQQGKLRGPEGNTTEVNVIRQQQQPRRAYATTNGRHHASPQQQRPSAYNSSTCKWCGKHPHKRFDCPAKDAVCNLCSKKGHFSCVCMSAGKVKAITVHDVEAEASAIFIDTLDANNSEPWYETITVDGVDIGFKLDSGADVTCIPVSVYVKLMRPRDLQKTNRLLYGANNSPLTVMGIFTAHLAWRQNVCTTEVYIINDLRTPLLSRGACQALRLIIRAEEVTAIPDNIRAQYPQLFTGIGCMAEPYEIRIRPDAQPFALHAPRRVPLPLMAQVKTELEKVQQQRIIERVDTPTNWCAPMAVVPKRSGSLRLCVDLTRLNDAVMRERHMLPAVDQTLAMLTGATVFSKLDCNSSFFQIPLTPACMRLTTFITPFGLFCFRCLPQGLSSASEVFQKRMSAMLEGLEGCVSLIDDVLVFGHDKEQHDRRLHAVLQRLAAANLTLNDKCLFEVPELRFVGHIVSAAEIRPDPDEISAIVNMRTPANVSELRSYLGLINQLSKFSPHLAELSKLLHDLLKKDRQYLWSSSQDAAFDNLRQAICTAPTLALYDPNKPTQLAADASSHGLGAQITQRQPDGTWRPVCFASRSLSDVELRYAQ